MDTPCDWPVSYAGCSPDGTPPEPLASMAPSGVQQFEDAATAYLWNWTGKSYGLCDVTVQLCRQDSTAGLSSFNGSGPFRTPYGTIGWLAPVIVQGLWYNVGCGACGDTCRCGGSAPLRLPGPVAGVTSITEAGEVLDPALYHVEDYSHVVRTDGKRWVACDLKIEYQLGTPVPIGGQLAAGVLAVELAKASCRDNSCQLPTRVQTITRQGVTIAMLDAFDDIDTGHTGIWIIDSWVASVTKPPVQSRVLSPDLPRSPARRRTS